MDFIFLGEDPIGSLEGDGKQLLSLCFGQVAVFHSSGRFFLWLGGGGGGCHGAWC